MARHVLCDQRGSQHSRSAAGRAAMPTTPGIFAWPQQHCSSPVRLLLLVSPGNKREPINVVPCHRPYSIVARASPRLV